MSDIVIKALAQGKDPGSTKAGELGAGDARTEERVRDLVEAISAAL